MIVTLALDAASQDFFEAQRQMYFPPARNVIPAHVTLFHALPGTLIDTVTAELQNTTCQPVFSIDVTGLRFLGNGTAYRLESAQLLLLRAQLAARFANVLTPQDAQRFQPHITIQNKVPALQAKQLYEQLTRGFAPFTVTAISLTLWHYRGGPWDLAAQFKFEDSAN